MKGTRLKEILWTIAMTLSILTSIILKIRETINFETTITIIGGTISIYLCIIKLIIENDKVFRKLFKEFNKRYSEDTNNIFNRLREDKDNKILQGEELMIINYFNLCSEEFFWHEKGRIPKCIWNAWKFGIFENFKIPIVKEIFEKEMEIKRNRKSYYGFAEFIEASFDCSQNKLV